MSPIRGIAFDLDGTLYRDDGPIMEAAYLDAGARAAVDLNPSLTIAEARSVATASFAAHGHYAPGFESFGIDRKTFHFRFHEFLDDAGVEAAAGLVEAMDVVGHANVVVLTHGSRHWAVRVLRRLGLAGHFPDSRILVHEDLGFSMKSSSRIPFETAMAVLGTEPGETAVVEDSPRNLPVPFAMGMRTYLVNYRRPDAPPDPCAHGERRSVIDVLSDIAAYNAGMRYAETA